MHLINQIFGLIILFVWFGEDVYMQNHCVHYNFSGSEVRKCNFYDEVQINLPDELSDQIEMTVSLTDKNISMSLTKSERNILTEGTILWDIGFDENDKQLVTERKLYQSCSMLKESQVYVGESAVIRIYQLNGVSFLDGVVGQYQFFYDIYSQKYVHQQLLVSQKNIRESPPIDQEDFDLQSSGGKKITIKLLIALDAMNIPSDDKITSIRRLVHHITAADMIFSKFSSPSIEFSITGFIFSIDTSSKSRNMKSEISVSDVDKKFFSDDNFDVTLFLSNELIPKMNDTKPSWSSVAIGYAHKPVFQYTWDSFNGTEMNYLNVANDLTQIIRGKKYLPTFPFFLNIPQVISDPFNLLKAWSCIERDIDITTPSTTAFSNTATPSTTTAAANASINLHVSDVTTNNTPQSHSNSSVFGCVIGGLLLLVLIIIISITVRKSKFTVWRSQRKTKNSKAVQYIFNGDYFRAELIT